MGLQTYANYTMTTHKQKADALARAIKRAIFLGEIKSDDHMMGPISAALADYEAAQSVDAQKEPVTVCCKCGGDVDRDSPSVDYCLQCTIPEFSTTLEEAAWRQGVRDGLSRNLKQQPTEQPRPMSPKERESVNKFFWSQFEQPGEDELFLCKKCKREMVPDGPGEYCHDCANPDGPSSALKVEQSGEARADWMREAAEAIVDYLGIPPSDGICDISAIIAKHAPKLSAPNDSERLDWLEKNRVTLSTLVDDNGVFCGYDACRYINGVAHYFDLDVPTAREAIDAAMQKERATREAK